ncbi:hypothetical protein [Schaalia sp. Marseille-Q2122]|uniref:hypothetical protein n=1 Tax=Schaalia sp. Marseille-Q2122 TaxID=2736604 RepID=UPI0020CA2EE5|nr:hypothetical protein [Schaalia sp. Marseille-Q2122]
MRIALLAVVFFAVPLVIRLLTPDPYQSTSALIATIFVLFPAIVIALAVWDGFAEGLSLLWLLAPFVVFLPPMYIFFNDSALIYGVAYSILALLANGLASLPKGRSKS